MDMMSMPFEGVLKRVLQFKAYYSNVSEGGLEPPRPCGH